MTLENAAASNWSSDFHLRKRQLIDYAVRCNGIGILPLLAWAVMSIEQDPVVQTLLQCKSLQSLVDTWQRLERCIEAPNRIVASGVTRNAISLKRVPVNDGAAPTLAEDFFTICVLATIIDEAGLGPTAAWFGSLRCYPTADAAFLDVDIDSPSTEPWLITRHVQTRPISDQRTALKTLVRATPAD